MQELTNTGPYTYYTNYSTLPPAIPNNNKNKFRLMAFGAFGLAFLLLLGGSAYAAYTLYFDSSARLVASMFAQLDKVRFADTKTNISMAIKLNGFDPYGSVLGDSIDRTLAQALFWPPVTEAQSLDTTITGTFNGKIAFDDNNKLQKSDLSLEFSANGLDNVTHSGTEDSYVFAMDMRQPDPDSIYLRFTKIPQLGLFDTDALLNKWVNYSPEMSTLLPGVDKTKQEELAQNLTTGIKKIWEKHRLTMFVLSRGSNDRVISSVSTKHVQYSVDTTVLKAFLQEAVEAYDQYNRQLAELTHAQYDSASHYSSDEYLQHQLEQREKQVDAIINSIQQISGNIWIGSDSLPYGYDMNATFAYAQDNINSEVALNLSTEANSYNQDFTVETPADALTPLELFSLTLPAIDIQATANRATDSMIRSNAARLKTGLDLYNIDFGVYPKNITELDSYGYSMILQEIQSSGKFTYTQTQGGKNYMLCVTLSDLSQLCTDKDQSIRSSNPL